MNNQSLIAILKVIKDPKSILGILISIVGMYWAFKDFNYSDFTLSIKNINYVYLLLATFLLWCSVWIRGIRWKFLFKIEISPSVASLYKAEMIGMFGNNILPLRLGELLRSYIVGKENALPTSFVFGTIVMERLLDTLTLGIFGLLLFFIYPIDASIKKVIIIFALSSLMVTLIFYFILPRLNLFKSENKIVILIKRIFDGLLSINRKKIIPVFITSLVIWCIYLFDVYLLQLAFKFNLSWSEILTLLVISSLALSVPSAPGMIGTYHAAIKYTMVDLFAFTPNEGNSFAILMHSYGFILFTFSGAYYFIKNQFSNQAMGDIICND